MDESKATRYMPEEGGITLVFQRGFEKTKFGPENRQGKKKEDRKVRKNSYLIHTTDMKVTNRLTPAAPPREEEEGCWRTARRGGKVSSLSRSQGKPRLSSRKRKTDIFSILEKNGEENT